MKSQKLSILDLIHAAQELKYLIDIQPPGSVSHPGRGEGEDVRDSDAYRRIAETLIRFSEASKHSDVYYTDEQSLFELTVSVNRCSFFQKCEG